MRAVIYSPKSSCSASSSELVSVGGSWWLCSDVVEVRLALLSPLRRGEVLTWADISRWLAPTTAATMSGISAVVKGRISEALVVFTRFGSEGFLLLALFPLFPVVWPDGDFVLSDFFAGIVLAFFADFFCRWYLCILRRFLRHDEVCRTTFTWVATSRSRVTTHAQLFQLMPSMHCNRLVNSIAEWIALFGWRSQH